MRLLIVEDSRRIREALADGLTAAGFAVDAVADGRQGLSYARTTQYDVIVLDLMLPEIDGLSVLRDLRREGHATPVLILSARDRVTHRVEGLRAGADDYLVKPFAFEELLARIEALCRRSHGVPASIVRLGPLVIDLACRQVSVNDTVIALTPREYALLEYLIINAGWTVSRIELEEHIYSADRPVWSNAVDSAIVGVRRKLAEAGVTDLIQTRRGHGYLIVNADRPLNSTSSLKAKAPSRAAPREKPL